MASFRPEVRRDSIPAPEKIWKRQLDGVVQDRQLLLRP
jgi:hypothetical protein